MLPARSTQHASVASPHTRSENARSMAFEEGDATTPAPKTTWWNPLHALRALQRMGDDPDPEHPEPVVARGSALDVMVVVQLRPAWEIQAYLRFAGLPYRVENARYAGSAATGLYPALMDGQFALPADGAAGHVARRRKDLDSALSSVQKAESQAFSMLVREGLQPLLRVMRYRGGEGEIRETVHPPMLKAMSWPLTWWSPAAEGRRSKQESTVRGLDGLSKAELIERVKGMYAALDLRLGKSEEAFFFGPSPTSLDACVFGHLAEAWTIAGLLEILPAFDNLSRFFRRVCDEYFRPGGFPPSSPPGGGQGVPNGAGGEGMAGTGGGTDGGGAGDGDGDGGAAMTESLRQAMLRADYVNSLNAFNQLPGCALCSEVPYIEDPFPRRPIENAGIPRPAVLAGNMPGAVPTAESAAAAAAEAATDDEKPADDSLPLKYTALSTVAFCLLSTILSRY
ncbi:unnamed protein product [Pylaiella littoralis]